MPPVIHHPSSTENELLRRLLEIEAQITDLEAERKVIQRLLQKVRKDEIGNKDVTRRNSVSRVIVETRIIQVLNNAKKPLSSNMLYNDVKSYIGDLKENTFRSHLHRMKLKGVIEQTYRGGPWKAHMSKS